MYRTLSSIHPKRKKKQLTTSCSMLRLLAVTIIGISLLLNLPLLITADPPEGSLDTDTDALLDFYYALSSVGTRLDWNKATNVCEWVGIFCTHELPDNPGKVGQGGGTGGDRVVEVRLPAVGLIGPIASQSIGKLHALKVLSLRNNSLYGNLPPDIFSVSTLKNIHLQGNKFCGDLPVKQFRVAQSLEVLDLSLNSFSGNILSLFEKTPKLMYLNLSFNKFSGHVPPIKGVKDLRQLYLANNMFEGPIPDEYKNIEATFDGNHDLCGPLLATPCSANSPAYSPEQNAVNCNKLTYHGALVISSVLFLLLLSLSN